MSLTLPSSFFLVDKKSKMYALMAEPEAKAKAKAKAKAEAKAEAKTEAVAKARMKFNVVKQTFLDKSQPGDRVAVGTEFKSWLGPELLLPAWPGYFAWYEETYDFLPVRLPISSSSLYFHFHKDVAVRAACEVFWANTWTVYANRDDMRYILLEITFIKRRWMSVARVAWMSAVLRGII